MFGERFISGVILLAITIALVVSGGYVLFAAVTVISLIGLFELYRSMKIEKTPLAWVGYLGSLALDGWLLWKGEGAWTSLLVVCLLLILAVYVFCFPAYSSEQVTMTVFGLLYVTVMLSYLYRIRALPDGLWLIWLVFLCSWGSDTCAYCVGKLIGKRRLPGRLKELSPKKSVEGCIGGIAGAALLGLLYGILAGERIGEIQNPAAAFALISGAGAVISQIGDLAASAIKRNQEIKDYGTLIPGHGGILDRFDSVIFTAPIVFLLAKLL